MQIADKTVVIKCQGSVNIPWKDIRDFQGDLKILPDDKYAKLRQAILELGFSEPPSVWWDEAEQCWQALNGHQRLKALARMEAEGFTIPVEIPCSKVEAADRKEAKRKILSLTSQFGEMTGQGLFDFMAGAELQFDQVKNFALPEIDMNVFEANFIKPQGDGGHGAESSEATVHNKLHERFIAPPFSILDSKQGYWQDRRRQWMSLGIESELGRKENLLGMSATMLQPDPKKRNSMVDHRKGFMDVGGYDGGNAFMGLGTSVFDPVLCEVAYKWFCPLGGNVLDPFAGGSVRGIVAAQCGYNYTGSELRDEQVVANQQQAEKICKGLKPEWVPGDSQNIATTFQGRQFDLIFSCPPYADLEQYSDDPRDLSNMEHGDFLEAYKSIIRQSVGLLKDNRFCVWVISDVRYKGGGGFYRGLTKDTIQFFEDAGAGFYNDMVLLNAIGTAALRAGRQFSATRKVGRIHQNVLVFCKGDVANAVQELGEIQVALPENSNVEEEVVES